MAPPSVSSPPEPAAESDAGADASYTCKPSLLGSVYTFALTSGGLSWRAGWRDAVWAYDDIAMVRMSYRPASIQMRRYRTDIWNRRGQRIIVMSTTWQSMALMQPQDESYRAFIAGLHRRIAKAGGGVLCEGGLMPWVYYLAALLLGLVVAAMIGLLVQAVAIGSTAGALFLAGVTALFAWQIGTFMVRNRPVRYHPAAPPAHLLP